MLILFIVSNTIIMEIRPKVNNNRIRKQKNFPRTFGTFPKIGIFDFLRRYAILRIDFSRPLRRRGRKKGRLIMIGLIGAMTVEVELIKGKHD